MVDYEAAARFLFDLLDDIDTCGDIAKSDDKLYRGMVEKIQQKRFAVAETDGYSLVFKEGKLELQRTFNADSL